MFRVYEGRRAQFWTPGARLLHDRACLLCVCANSKHARALHVRPWLPDGYSQIFRLYVFGPSGFWNMAPLRYAAKFDSFLAPPHPPPWRNPRKGRDQILPSGNLVYARGVGSGCPGAVRLCLLACGPAGFRGTPIWLRSRHDKTRGNGSSNK